MSLSDRIKSLWTLWNFDLESSLIAFFFLFQLIITELFSTLQKATPPRRMVTLMRALLGYSHLTDFYFVLVHIEYNYVGWAKAVKRAGDSSLVTLANLECRLVRVRKFHGLLLHKVRFLRPPAISGRWYSNTVVL